MVEKFWNSYSMSNFYEDSGNLSQCTRKSCRYQTNTGRLSFCCCQVTSVVSDFVPPHRQQPTRLPRPRDSPGKNTGVGCHFLLQCMKVKSESEVAQSCLTLSDPKDCSPHQAPPSMGFSRQEYWSGVPLLSPILSSYCCHNKLPQTQWLKIIQIYYVRVLWYKSPQWVSRD